MFYLFFSLVIVAILTAFIICKFSKRIDKEKFNKIIAKILKISVITYCALSLLSILLPDAMLLSYSYEETLSSPISVGIAMLKWFSCLAFIMLPLAVFYKNRIIRNIAVYFCTIITILQIIFYPQFLEMFTSSIGRGLNSISVLSDGFKEFLLNPILRSTYIGIIWGLELLIPITLAIQEKHVINIKNWKEILLTVGILLITLISCIPIYIPQHLFGYTDLIFEAWTLPHFIWLALVVVEIISLYFIFRKKSTDLKMIMLFILSLSLLMQYNQMFGAISLNIKRLPFQLCNIGSYLILVALITKSKKIFDFTVIVNVVGVILALAVPDLDGEGLFYLYNMHFILEHTNVLVVPVLSLLLGIFPRLDKKSLKHFFFGFLIYYVCVFVLGTVFNGIALATDNSFYYANYLFMFDQATAADLIPFMGKLFDFNFRIGIFTFYPLMQIIVYVVFNLICFAIFGVIQLIYKIKDRISKPRNNPQENVN